MTYSPTFGPAAAEVETLGRDTQAQVVKVEFVMDSHRVVGELRHTGPPRRIVDMLNSIDSGYISIFDGVVDNAARPGEGARKFDAAQVRRDAIMLAIPRTEYIASGTSLEAVRKVPIPATFVVPGYEVSGSMYLVAEADPLTTPILASRHFIPLTDAVITPAHEGPALREPLVIVNLVCALFYAPHTLGD